ncbi:hypothetical protein SAMN05216179_2997 [Gracilibacillus kekensis]|uniref:Uncharacterized protein n=1 Tax=Gracilibacillus kekensis TaxID=1027249 RepID=A0A1M7QAV5_9BACI|nr:hypothetical protein SAMN05216179_2997 [Gracilibacillus kekensis]
MLDINVLKADPILAFLIFGGLTYALILIIVLIIQLTKKLFH